MDGLLFDVSQYETKPKEITPYDCDRDIESDVAEMLRECARRKAALAELAKPPTRRLDGEGHLFEKVYKRNGKEYYQLWFQYMENNRRTTKYVRQHLEEKVRSLYRNGASRKEILALIE